MISSTVALQISINVVASISQKQELMFLLTLSLKSGIALEHCRQLRHHETPVDDMFVLILLKKLNKQLVYNQDCVAKMKVIIVSSIVPIAYLSPMYPLPFPQALNTPLFQISCIDQFSHSVAFGLLLLPCCIQLRSMYERPSYIHPFFLTDITHHHIHQSHSYSYKQHYFVHSECCIVFHYVDMAHFLALCFELLCAPEDNYGMHLSNPVQELLAE